MNYVPQYPHPPGYMPYNLYHPPGYMPYNTYRQQHAPTYSARFGTRTTTPSPYTSPYTPPRGHCTYMPPDFQSPRYYATPRRTPVDHPLKRSHSERRRRPSRVHIWDDDNSDDVYDPPPLFYEQYEQKQRSSRHRRASQSSRPQRPSASKSGPKATEEDARRAGIPAGYSYKNWDPTEEPIMLLGSVFDANSLGKWIYDWTVFCYGSATPLAEMAGELWVLLIQLAGKVKRAEETMPKIRKQESHEMVEEFLESGERLWIRFAKLLKVCEDYMWKAAKKESGNKKPMPMGKNSGCEFVNSIFGRDRELEKTEKLMTSMRLWSMRFDANCDDILNNPTA